MKLPESLPDFHIVIPARYASQRFPKKLLSILVDKPVLQWVYELSLQAGAQSVVIATDHESIFAAASEFGANVIMTRDDHENGTERLAEVAEKMGWFGDEIIVNVQGDEPLLPVDIIHQAVMTLANDTVADMATVASPIRSEQDFFNPNVVKLVADANHRALYFSRAPIPWDRDGFSRHQYQQQNQSQQEQKLKEDMPAFRHIGLYVYRARLLANYQKMPMSPLERWEKLEQLRLLHQGVAIGVAYVDSMPPHGVDTPEDLEKLHTLLT
ncbi:3-deoxy-manno-octulosonate cytidylyltransferase [Marinomonas agarivorans]|nr:3-deoxy-manno-octulosonate cytidylyltransferase [Marinomonas agarivorans]